MFSFVYMLHEGVLVVYTLASALVRLEVGLIVCDGLTVSVGLPTVGGALVGLLLVVAVRLAALVVTVVVVLMTVVGLVAGFAGLDTVGRLAFVGAVLALVTRLVLAAAGGLTGLAGLAEAWLEGLAGLVGLDRFAMLVSACCSGPFSCGLLTTAGGWSIIRSRWNSTVGQYSRERVC